ncbi:sensor histidine kinase [Anaerotalea alkaliphila]|uniref:histidine kinase n=1 Tax=Anaerotalea alkaliphila TaxID=2662126 RepID=A0A7X5KMV7_9FIRM|nr:ATP-binding protein [Anaerotalea alkaliphila]NDL67113.1 HAMP domain-containing protein [Anaerotalea alkaliphila]
MESMTSVLLQILKGILLWPVRLVRDFVEDSIALVGSLGMSIRKKILVGFLFSYLLVSLVSVGLSSYLFLHRSMGESGDALNQRIAQMLLYQRDGDSSMGGLADQLEYLASTEEAGIQILWEDEAGTPFSLAAGLLEDMPYETDGWARWEAFRRAGVLMDPETVYEFQDGKDPGRLVVRLAYPVERFLENFLHLLWSLVLAQATAFFFLAILVSGQIRRMLKPIDDMTDTARRISIDSMQERIPLEKTNAELKDLALTLNDMLDRLDKEYEKQKQFVSDVSHELRTPIAILHGYVSMLGRWGKQDEEVLEESIDAMLEETRNMQALVENLLTLVRSDSQTLEFHKTEFDLQELLGEVVKESRMLDVKNQTILHVPRGPVPVHMDEAMIKQTLRVFLDNAAKYTQEGGTIQVGIDGEEGAGACTLWIRDNGVGIPERDLSRLFDRFYRSDESRTRQTGGHGLGLAIAKAIVEGHQGSIRVESKLGEGSVFYLDLPLDLRKENQ